MGLTAVSAKRKKAFNSGLKKLVGTLFVREVETLVSLSCVRDFFFEILCCVWQNNKFYFMTMCLRFFGGGRLTAEDAFILFRGASNCNDK